MKKQSIFSIYNNERGVSAIWVALMLFIFIGLGAFALDFSHIFVAKNELQNAADASALAGALFLYNDYGTEVNEGANQEAYDGAVANKSENVPVELLADGVTYANVGDTYPVQQAGDDEDDLDILRGHWNFATSEFTANASLLPVELWGRSDDELDADLDFINAVKVTTRRNATPIVAFFAGLFGYENFQQKATAVAYIGFAGTLAPGDVDAPIAICKQSLIIDDANPDECKSGGTYQCNIGYMLSDGQDKNTAAWTNFTDPCETASTTSLRPLLTCENANPEMIDLGSSIGATNGVVDSVIGHPQQENLVDCWKGASYDSDGDGIKDTLIDGTDTDDMPERPWNVYLPVVNCPDFKVSNCMETCGGVNINIIWILEKENDINADAPYEMTAMVDNVLKQWVWSKNEGVDGGIYVDHIASADGIIDGKDRWNSFVEAFNLFKPNGVHAYYDEDPQISGFKKKSIYFLPDCTDHELKGTSGGHNYGVLARIPVLVK